LGDYANIWHETCSKQIIEFHPLKFLAFFVQSHNLQIFLIHLKVRLNSATGFGKSSNLGSHLMGHVKYRAPKKPFTWRGKQILSCPNVAKFAKQDNILNTVCNILKYHPSAHVAPRFFKIVLLSVVGVNS
jgi:hypothetical protein